MKFIHLKTHSEYSIIDGLVRVGDLIRKTRDDGASAVAITDRMNLFSLVKFYKKATSAGVKPIVGADLVLKSETGFTLVTALCKNDRGYLHLRELISRAYLEGQSNGQVSIEWEWLAEKADGLIILSGGRHGDIGKALLSGDLLLAEKNLARWTAVFPDHFYLELQRTNRASEEVYIQAAVSLAEKKKIPVVATNDIRFLNQEDFDAHEARVCIQSSRVLQDPKRPKHYSDQQYLKSPEQMCVLFSDIPEALENTVEIAKRCTVELVLDNPCLPQFPTPEGMSLEAYIRLQSEAGLNEFLQTLPDVSESQKAVYFDRLTTELNVINTMGFPGYFLIVADFIQWAKDNDIPVGPGRGSGAGSLVAFVLGITDLDPIAHELLFERFLNPERVSMPDFDVDFCMDNRDRVIEYVANRYGREAVSQIITYGTMAAKAVVRDVGRVLGYPYGLCDRIAKLIPFEIGMTLDKALIQEAELAKLYETDGEVTTLIDLAKKLEGLTRNAGKHAGGVVIAPTKLTDFSALYCEAGSTQLVTQFDKDDVEAVGLVKFDFLGLRTLTIIQWAVNAINKRRKANNEAPIDIRKLPTDDVKTFDLLKSCATTAVFQLESRGMKDLIRRLQPDCFDEITALVALFRPGPLQSGMVDDFIDRKHGRDVVQVLHPDIEGILAPTFGVILYQEQVMQIAQILAGYSLGGADILRRAMGKKKPEEMAKQRVIFVEGATGRGVEKKTAEHIFDLMEKFAGYGFNKSHSAAYALLSYQTAWLKAHYPAEFMAAVLSSDMDNTDKVVGFYRECESMRLKVLPPNVNEGLYQFTVNDQGDITYGIGAIKGVGESAVQNIVQERAENGLYRDLFDFCQRVDLHKVSRRTLEPLIRSGAMDCFEESRSTLLASVNKAIKAADQHRKNSAVGQDDLFGLVDPATDDSNKPDYVFVAEEEVVIRLQGEKDALGMYLSGHPIQLFEAELSRMTTCGLSELPRHMGKSVAIAGLLISVRRIITKSGRRMAILTLEDRGGQVEVALFSKLFEEMAPYLEKNEVFILRGKVEEDSFNQGARLVVDSIDHLDHKRAGMAKQMLINANNQPIDEIIQALPVILKPFCGGECVVTVEYMNDQAKGKLQLGDAWKVTPKNTLIAQLKQLCGNNNVTIEY